MELVTGLTADAVCSFAAGPNGWLYIVNGEDPVYRWRGDESGAAVPAGLAAPDTSEYPMEAAGGGSGGGGAYAGTYKAFVRFWDADAELPSSFDEVGVEFTLSADHSQVDYSAIPTSGLTGVKGVYRQIWRSTAGQQTTYYLDVTIEDDTTVEATSTKTDEQLRACEAMRFLTADGYPNANRHVPPPDHMAVVACYQDRLWFAVSSEPEYRRSIFFSEAGEPESVPDVNVVQLQGDGDEITGLMVAGPYLYVLSRRHIYRLGTSGDPRNDVAVVLVAERGCCNQRCWTRVEGQAFLLDENGPWIFNGSGVDPIGEAIHDYVPDRITWASKDTFAVAKDAMEETVRFFVAMDDASTPQGSLAYGYRTGVWWEEDYGGIGSGGGGDVYGVGEADIDGLRRTVLSADFNGSESLVYLNNESYDEEAPIEYELKLGAFELLPLKPGNERRLEIFYKPVVVDEANDPPTMNVEVFFDGSATAEAAAWSFANDLGATTTTGSGSVAIDLTDTSGYAALTFSTGMARTFPVPRLVEFVLSGTAYQSLTIYEVRITGVR